MTFSKRIDSLKQKIHLENLNGIYVTNLTNVRYKEINLISQNSLGKICLYCR